MLNPDRLTAVTEELVRLIESTPIPEGAMPPAGAMLLRVARMAGIDVETLARSSMVGSLRSLSFRASADPSRADALAGWVAHLVAWLREERDDPPPAEIPTL